MFKKIHLLSKIISVFSPPSPLFFFTTTASLLSFSSPSSSFQIFCRRSNKQRMSTHQKFLFSLFLFEQKFFLSLSLPLSLLASFTYLCGLFPFLLLNNNEPVGTDSFFDKVFSSSTRIRKLKIKSLAAILFIRDYFVDTYCVSPICCSSSDVQLKILER